MARKLKSDKWLFLATFVLVCTSVIMVYSASAVVLVEKGAELGEGGQGGNGGSGAQLARQRLGQRARIRARGLGEDHRRVGRDIAMTGVARRLHRHR